MEMDYNDHESGSSSDGNTLFPKSTTVPRLEAMASVTVAVALLNGSVVELEKTFVNYNEWYFSTSLRIKGLEFLKALNVPKPLAEGIASRFHAVRSELPYLFRTVFFNREQKSCMYQFISYIVWHPDGSIDVIKTIRNLLKSEEWSPMEKFCLACTFCLRDEIERMWPTLEVRNQVNQMTFDSNTLIYYWKCHCTQTLNEIPVPAYRSIDDFMIELPAVNNWPAIEYFFDRLNAEQRVAVATWLIRQHGVRFQKLILIKLSQTQVFTVVTENAYEVMKNFASCDDVERAYTDTISTWYAVRDFIPPQEFAPLFNQLIGKETAGVILTEIWNTARNDFKPDFYKYPDHLFIGLLLRWFEKQIYKNQNCLTFLSTVLLDAVSIDVKQEITKTIFFKDFCRHFLCDNYYFFLPDVESLGKLIDLCSPNPAESNRFKSAIAKRPYFRKICKRAMKDHLLEWLLELLNFGYPKTDPKSDQRIRNILRSLLKYLDGICLGDYYGGDLDFLNELLAPLIASYPDIVVKYKSKLLLSNGGLEACAIHLNPTKDDLNKIIDDGLPVQLAAKFKRKLILSPEGIVNVKKLIVDERLNNVDEFIGQFLKSKSDIGKLKEQLGLAIE
ncbi:uncharacterized protein LOC135844396 isoform X15 [Planococcus citri]|uniref:uncharacterized protein LOC135844396 isoform X15 n=1 Tax=Planococcus citri TaxID=170843 RepID=UPI0031F77217